MSRRDQQMAELARIARLRADLELRRYAGYRSHAEAMRRHVDEAREELAASSEFDVTVVNHDVGETAHRLVELSAGPPVSRAGRGTAPTRRTGLESGATPAGASE